MATNKLVKRADRLSFMDSGSEGLKFDRMTKFTTLTNSKNPKEYSRQYIDMNTETSDVVGYAPSYEYSYDYHTGNKVHEKIATVTDDELTGSDAYVDVVTVDVFASTDGTTAPARKRQVAIVPDSEGDGTDALIYSGNLKAVSEIIKGTATTSDNWLTVTFEPTV